VKLAVRVDGQPYRLSVISDAMDNRPATHTTFPVQATLQGDDATFSIDGHLGWPLVADLDTSMKISLSGRNLTRTAALFTIPLPALGRYQLETRLLANQELFQLGDLSAALEKTTLRGNLFLDRRSNRPFFKTSLQIDRLSQSLLERLTSQPETESPVSIDYIKWLRDNDGEFDFSIGRAGWRRQTIRNFRLNGKAEAGRLTMALEPVATFARQIKGNLAIDTSKTGASYQLQVAGKAIRIKELIAFIGSSGELSGTAKRLDVRISGKLAPAPRAGMDDLKITLQDASLKLPVSDKKTFTATVNRASTTLDPGSRQLQIKAQVALNGSDLDILLDTSMPARQKKGGMLPLDLQIRSSNIRIDAKGRYRYTPHGLQYQTALSSQADSLARLGRLLSFPLPETGPVEFSADLNGTEKSLQWNKATMELPGIRLTGRGEVEFAQGPLKYSTRTGIQAIDTSLLRRIISPSIPLLGPVAGKVDLQGDLSQLSYDIPELAVGDSRLKADGTFQFGSEEKRSFHGNTYADSLQLANFSVTDSEIEKEARQIPESDADHLIPAIPIDFTALKGLTLTHDLDIKHLLQGDEDLGEYKILTRIEKGSLTTRAVIHSRYLQTINIQASGSSTQGGSQIEFQAKAEGLNYGALFKIFDVSNAIEGKLDFTTDFQGAGKDLRQIIANGTGQLTISGGEGKTDYAALRLWGGSFIELLFPPMLTGTKPGRMECLAARYHLVPGRVSSEGIVINLEKTLIIGSIQVDLPSEKISAVFKPEPKSARLLTIDTPVVITGSLSRPTIKTVSAESMLALGKLVAGIYNPAYLVVLFGSLGNTVENPCEAVLNGEVELSSRDLRDNLEDLATSPLRLLERKGKGKSSRSGTRSTETQSPLIPPGQ